MTQIEALTKLATLPLRAAGDEFSREYQLAYVEAMEGEKDYGELAVSIVASRYYGCGREPHGWMLLDGGERALGPTGRVLDFCSSVMVDDELIVGLEVGGVLDTAAELRAFLNVLAREQTADAEDAAAVVNHLLRNGRPKPLVAFTTGDASAFGTVLALIGESHTWEVLVLADDGNEYRAAPSGIVVEG